MLAAGISIGKTQKILSNKTIEEIAKSHGKTPAQIVLRWHIQAGYVVIPGSGNPSHIRENNDIYNFELSDDEMKLMTKLNRNQRFENW